MASPGPSPGGKRHKMFKMRSTETLRRLSFWKKRKAKKLKSEGDLSVASSSRQQPEGEDDKFTKDSVSESLGCTSSKIASSSPELRNSHVDGTQASQITLVNRSSSEDLEFEKYSNIDSGDFISEKSFSVFEDNPFLSEIQEEELREEKKKSVFKCLKISKEKIASDYQKESLSGSEGELEEPDGTGKMNPSTGAIKKSRGRANVRVVRKKESKNGSPEEGTSGKNEEQVKGAEEPPRGEEGGPEREKSPEQSFEDSKTELLEEGNAPTPKAHILHLVKPAMEKREAETQQMLQQMLDDDDEPKISETEREQIASNPAAGSDAVTVSDIDKGKGDMAPTAAKREHLYKILVIGELGTGKTSIIKRYVHQFFSQHYRATIGVDFALKVINWDENTTIRLQLWDIAGQERFGNMTRVYYKEAVGAFIVFDVTRVATFDAVLKWKQDLDSKVQLSDGSPVPCVLLANKCDQPKEGLVSNQNKMNEYCRDKGFSTWFETSAKENINIEDAAKYLVNEILKRDKLVHSNETSHDRDKFSLQNQEKPSSRSCMC